MDKLITLGFILTLITWLLPMPAIMGLLFPANPVIAVSVSALHGQIDGVKYDTTINRPEGLISEVLTVTIQNDGDVPAKNVLITMSQTPQSTIWYDFHNFKVNYGINAIDYQDNSVELPEIPAHDRTVIEFYISFSVEEYNRLSAFDLPQIMITTSTDEAGELEPILLDVIIPDAQEFSKSMAF